MVIDTPAPVGDPHFSTAYSVILFCHYPRHSCFFFLSPQPLFSSFCPFATTNCLPPSLCSALPSPTLVFSSHLLYCKKKNPAPPSSSPQTILSFFLVVVHPPVPLLSSCPPAASGWKSPRCTSTAWAWGCSPRGSACWTSPRRSSCAWRPWSSSASVSLPPGAIVGKIMGPGGLSQRLNDDQDGVQPYFKRIDGRDNVRQSYCCVLALCSQCQWRARGTGTILMNCEPPTSGSWTAWRATTGRPPAHRGCFSSHSCWTTSSR